MEFLVKFSHLVSKFGRMSNNKSAYFAWIWTSARSNTQRRNQDTTHMNVFDRHCKLAQRNRAAVTEDSDIYDYIREEISYRLADRVYDIKRKFDVVIYLGCGKGFVGSHLSSDAVGFLCYCDSSTEMLKRVKPPADFPSISLLVDEESLPFTNDSVDMVVSCLRHGNEDMINNSKKRYTINYKLHFYILHWVNNLPGTFRQVYNVLRSDGVFLAAIFGGDTLYELRCSLQLAEIEREGGFAAHISPFTSVQDIGSLLNRAGFTMLTVDVDEMKINFPSMMEVMWDVKGMGENNAAWNRKSHLHRDTILSGASIYKELYGNKDGSVPATFQIMYLIGWKPDSSQPKPAQRGSANVSLKDLSNISKVVHDKLSAIKEDT